MKFLYTIFSIFCSLALSAQGNLQTADDYFIKGDFEKALQHLQIMINQPEQLKGDDLAYAYLLRAKTYINLLDRAVKSNLRVEIEKYKDAYFMAFEDIKEIQKKEYSASVKKETEALRQYLHHTLSTLGANFLNKIYNTPNLEPHAKDAILDEAQKYFNATLSLKKDDYTAHDCYAQVMMLKRADDLAMEHYRYSILHYKHNIKRPDFEHFRVFGNMAILFMKKKNATEALKIIEEGLEKLKKEYDSFLNKNADTEKIYTKLRKDLHGIEMDIYLNSPELLEKALLRFSQLVYEYPDDYSVRIGYAQILDQNSDFEKAINELDQAINIDSTLNLAWFNLGVLNMNRGLENSKQGKKISIEDVNIKKAVFALKKALELNKSDLICMDALMKLYSKLELKDEYLYIRQMKTERIKNP